MKTESFKGNQQDDKKIAIDISENGISIHGQLFEFPFNVNELKKIFGQPERSETFNPNENGNTIHTWDKIGVYVYAKKEFDVFDVSIKLSFHLSHIFVLVAIQQLIKIQDIHHNSIYHIISHTFLTMKSFETIFLSAFLWEVNPCGWIRWNGVVAFASELDAKLSAGVHTRHS